MLQTVRLFLALICVLLTLQVRIAAKPSTSASEKKGDRPTSARPAAPKRTARQLQAEVDQALMEERLNHRDTEPWPKETDEDHAAALKDLRKVVDEVARQYPRGKVYETKYFICFSNIPETQIRPYVDALDHMYEYMCQLYEISLDRKVWRGGKAPVFAFLEEKQLESFEKKYFPHIRKMLGKNLGYVAALCHRAISGEVVISCWRGDDPAFFGHSLVHETSHGFNHRYKTKRFLPNWVDEGLAEIVGAEMLPACTMVSRREAVAIRQLAQQRSFGGMFAAERITSDQYGMASNLTRFLLKSDQKAYVQFISRLKEGMWWPDALQAAYHNTPDEMLAYYGRAIGVPDLQP